MNIFYTTDSRFAAKVAASICSVFENNFKMDQINIYIIGQNLTKRECENFSLLGRQYKRNISVIEMGEVSRYIDFPFDTNGWNPIVLTRLLVDRFLPLDIDKVLYLDGDTIDIASLEDLWKIDLGQYALGGCIEATVDFERRKALGMETIPYINAGVLLINLKEWREQRIGERIIKYYREHRGNLFANDQDAINGTLKNKIYYLPPRYNFYNIYWTYPYEFLKKLMRNTYYYDKKTFDASLENPAVIHYLGEERPWRRGNRHMYRIEYKRFLSKTPWKNEKDEEGWRVYFICWNLFNLFMKPFPGLRYNIINKLIPVFMKFRKMKLEKKK